MWPCTCIPVQHSAQPVTRARRIFFLSLARPGSMRRLGAQTPAASRCSRPAALARQIVRPFASLRLAHICSTAAAPAGAGASSACRSPLLGVASPSSSVLQPRMEVVSRSSGASAQPLQERPGQGNNWLQWLLAAAVVGAGLWGLTTPYGLSMREYLVNGPLGRSGFLAAFSLIFLSEIGDKTFFIAALLAMKLGKWISFLGSLASLSVMTIISVSIGAIFSRVPDAIKSSVPVGELAGIALLLFFGLKALRDGMATEEGPAASEEEMADAEDVVKQAETSGRMSQSVSLSSFFQVATLIFIAEWGDRSMLATIALGAAQNPIGVATGAIAGHAIATGIAVVGGTIASKYVSEKTINVISGALFILFAIATAVSLL